MKKYFVCDYCGYWWKGSNEEYERCHCPVDGFLAPCEYEDDYTKESEEDYVGIIFKNKM